jgi:acetyl esterase/lipase
LLFGAGTLVALVPIRRPPALARVSYLVGLVVNELPFVVIYFLVVSTALAFAEGDIESTGSWLAVGAAALTVVGLVVVAVRALSTRATVDRALRAGLGDDWRDVVDPDLRVRSGRRRLPVLRILFAPFAFGGHGVERIRNITYGAAGKHNLLDVYRNRARPGGAPMLIHFHGGHFQSGKKSRESRVLFYRLASHGWVCVSANYRLGRGAAFPDHLVDAKQVIAWVRAHGAEQGGDPSTLFVAGSSAGGHMAAMAALTANDPEFQPGFERVDTSVTAAIPLYAYLGPLDTNEGRASSPFDYARADRPPFFVVHGDHDTVVPVEQARAFAAELGRTSSVPVVFAELRGAQHVFDMFHSIRYETVVDAIEDFAAWVRSPQPTGTSRVAATPPAPRNR